MMLRSGPLTNVQSSCSLRNSRNSKLHNQRESRKAIEREQQEQQEQHEQHKSTVAEIARKATRAFPPSCFIHHRVVVNAIKSANTGLRQRCIHASSNLELELHAAVFDASGGADGIGGSVGMRGGRNGSHPSRSKGPEQHPHL